MPPKAPGRSAKANSQKPKAAMGSGVAIKKTRYPRPSNRELDSDDDPESDSVEENAKSTGKKSTGKRNTGKKVKPTEVSEDNLDGDEDDSVEEIVKDTGKKSTGKKGTKQKKKVPVVSDDDEDDSSEEIAMDTRKKRIKTKDNRKKSKVASEDDEFDNDTAEGSVNKVKKKNTGKKKGAKPVVKDGDAAEESAKNTGSKDTRDKENAMVADANDVAELLGRKTQTGEFVFMQQSIIAERKLKGKKGPVEHLIIALPEWRRYNFKQGTGRDDAHAKAWDDLKADKRILTTPKETVDYDFIIHRYHPILSKDNGVDQPAGYFHLARNASQSTENFDKRDMREAKEMLGYMLEHAMDKGYYLTPEIFNMLEDGAFKNAYDPQANPYVCAQRFLDAFDLEQRGKIGRDLLSPKVVKDEDWIGSLAIALLSADEAMVQIGKLNNGRTTGKKKKEWIEVRYKEMTTNFLTQYHTEHKENDSFVYLLHVFYTLSQILREESKTKVEAGVGRIDDDDGSDGGSEGQDEAYGGGDDDFNDGEGQAEEAPRKGAKGKGPAKMAAAPKVASEAKATAMRDYRKRSASPTEELDRTKRKARNREPVIESDSSG